MMIKKLSLSIYSIILIFLLAGPALGEELKGLSLGMSESQTLKLLRKQSGKQSSKFLDSICSLPLGLDFHEGAPVYTWDTGLMMKKGLGFDPLYFRDGKLAAYKRDIRSFDQFLNLKKEHPQGRFSLHKFPGEEWPTRVFTFESDNIYAFTTEKSDLIVFDNTVRKEILSRVKGSACWHMKRFSPNVDGFVPEYLACVKDRRYKPAALASEDLESCKSFCANTPEVFASPECYDNCRQAHDQALKLSRESKPRPEDQAAVY